MNPFDLSGSDFLLFYAIFGAIVLAALVFWQRLAEGGEHEAIDPADPYLIAYLRGGAQEALRVATVALIDRGLLEVKEKTIGKRRADEIRVARQNAVDFARRPIERALLRHFAEEHDPRSIFDKDSVLDAAAAYELSLRERHLLPDDAALAARRTRAMIAAAVLVIVSATKVVIALERGRTNILFLVGLTAVFVALAMSGRPHRTPRGDAALADLRTLFRGLRDRADVIRPGGATNELALLVAVFGLAVLNRPEFAYARTLYPRAAQAGVSSGWWNTSWDSSWGSSCGSIGGGDGGGGGGSSCGGGSCGGGCGGCSGA